MLTESMFWPLHMPLAMRHDADWLLSLRDHEIASGFQRLVNKRSLPDYFEVIKEPMAFSTIRVG